MWKFLFLFIFIPSTLYAFWPIYWEFGGEKRFLGPLASYKQERDETHLTIRPLLFSYSSQGDGTYNYLYPLGRSEKNKSYFLPFYLSRSSPQREKSATDENITTEYSDTSFLFFFQCTSPRGNYGGLFPFYGTLNDRAGNDEMGFFMWPLYSYTQTDGAIKRNFMWPFFSVYSGKERGFKIWPLVGSRENNGAKKSSFFLWPIFYKEQDGLDTEEPQEKFYFIPFYLSSQSKKRDERMVMFPLYWYSKNPYREKTRILWPIFSFTEGEDEKGRSIFPLFSSEEKEDYKTLSILWPIVYSETEWHIRDRQYTKKRILLLNRYIDDEDGLFYNVWPVFERQEEQGRSHVFAPSILPIRSADFDRIIKPLFALIEHRKEGSKSMTSLLYGFFTTETEDEDWRIRLAFLFNLNKEGGKIGFEILSGLFGMDNSYVKVLFIPFKRYQQAEVKGSSE